MELLVCVWLVVGFLGLVVLIVAVCLLLLLCGWCLCFVSGIRRIVVLL